jgi:hypothetical protein
MVLGFHGQCSTVGLTAPVLGLARAFFYAKARALLVSHSPVNSDAAVKHDSRLRPTQRQSADRTCRGAGRSMVELITKGAPHEAHPANWAPFVLVGDGVR